MPMQPTLIRLLGALAPKTDAGTKYGAAKAEAVAADLTKSRRDISSDCVFFSTDIVHPYLRRSFARCLGQAVKLNRTNNALIEYEGSGTSEVARLPLPLELPKLALQTA